MPHIRVRDGRTGRGPAPATEAAGELLHEYDTERSPDLGDRVLLPDGTVVCIIGMTERIDLEEWSVDAVIGDLCG